MITLFNFSTYIDIDECQDPAQGGQCTQLCYNTPGSYYCDCNTGYRLAGDGITCEGMHTWINWIFHFHDYFYTHISDIDECLDNNGGCNHDCVNTVGSYECSCWKGYFLSDDARTCVGMNCTRFLEINILSHII